MSDGLDRAADTAGAPSPSFCAVPPLPAIVEMSLVASLTCRIRLLSVSATYKFVFPAHTPVGPSRSDCVESLLLSPIAQFADPFRPATVYMCPTIIEMPRCVPVDPAISSTRLVKASAM